jgi:hypothetical protein
MKKLMKQDFQFKEITTDGNEPAYLLILNDNVLISYAKRNFSKQEAETQASARVSLSIRRYGLKNVSYDGVLSK